MVLTVGLSAALANDETKVDPRVLSAFEKDFSFAKNAVWETEGDFSKVRFSVNDQGITAWYSEEAELIIVARNILYMNLPLAVIKSLEDRGCKTEISDIVEVTKNGETNYYMYAEEKGKKKMFEVTPSGEISVVKRIK